MQTPTVDFERLEDLTAGDPEFLQELVDMYLEDAQALLQDLQSALAKASAEDVGRTAHKLKGSSANMGAQRISHLATELEEAGRSASLGNAPQLVMTLENELGSVKVAFQRLLSS